MRKCYVCKEIQKSIYHSPKPGHCLKVELNFFSIWDYAGPIYYKTKKKSELKAYILLFSCSVTRAVHKELVSNLTTAEFIKSFKKLISRREKLEIVYSDNPKTFKAGAKWLANINKDQVLHDFLSSQTIIWKFNVPKAPW